jgi:hypothetical protein
VTTTPTPCNDEVVNADRTIRRYPLLRGLKGEDCSGSRDFVFEDDDAGAAGIPVAKNWSIVTAAAATAASIGSSCNTIATTISTTCATAAGASCPASFICHALITTAPTPTSVGD